MGYAKYSEDIQEIKDEGVREKQSDFYKSIVPVQKKYIQCPLCKANLIIICDMNSWKLNICFDNKVTNKYGECEKLNLMKKDSFCPLFYFRLIFLLLIKNAVKLILTRPRGVYRQLLAYPWLPRMYQLISVL